jgi:peptidoglycan/xylan/chitin deacetylase (PgdA/CDA1 family)
MKRLVKSRVQGAVAALAPKFWGRRGASLLVLMYHRVLPATHPERSSEQPGMYVSPETLRMHLEHLKRHFTLLHLEEWCQRARQGGALPPLACAVTFDDGWRDTFDFAWPVLRDAGVPATVFIVSNLVGTRYTFWPNRLARLLATSREQHINDGLLDSLQELRSLEGLAIDHGGALKPGEIDAAIMACKRARSDAEMSSLLERIAPGDCAVPAARDLMDWDEIREVSAHGQIRIGSHTRRHVRLGTGLATEIADDEIVGSRQEIAARLGAHPASFCYPNGDHSPASAALVGKHYRCAVTTQRGWNDRGSNLHLLARVGVHEEVSSSPAAFISRLAGVG